MTHTNADTVLFRATVAAGCVPNLVRPPIFASSTPETRPMYAKGGGRWRGAHADVLAYVLQAAFGAPMYATGWDDTPSGRKQLWVGHSGNITPIQRDQLMEAVRGRLRAMGHRVRRVRVEGLTRNLIVIDKVAPANA